MSGPGGQKYLYILMTWSWQKTKFTQFDSKLKKTPDYGWRLSAGRFVSNLILQLTDFDRQVENQLSHIFQLALQQVNGLSLTLVLQEKRTVN